MEIKIWADYACPYSYMGEKQLMDIIEKMGIADKVRIQFLSYQLDPNAPAVPTETMTQHFMSGHEYTEEQSQHLDLIPYMVFDGKTVLQGVISPGAMKKALAD